MDSKFKNKNEVVVIGKIEATNFRYDSTRTDFKGKFKGAYVKDNYKNNYMLRVLVERKDVASGKVIGTAHVNVDFAFGVFEKYEYNGEIKDNSTFTELKKISEAPNGGVGLPIRLSSGTFVENKYADKDFKFISNGNKFEGRYISLSNVDLDDAKAEGYVTGIIDSIRDDYSNGDTASGDKIVDFYTVKYVKDGTPVVDKLVFVVPEKLADDFERAFSEGDSARLDVEMVDVVSEAKVEVPTERSFGSRSAETTVSGKNTVQYQVFAGDVLSEGNEGFIDESELDAIKHSYEVSCEAMVQKRKEKEQGKTSSQSISSRTVDASAPSFFETAEDPFGSEETSIVDDLPFA